MLGLLAIVMMAMHYAAQPANWKWLIPDEEPQQVNPAKSAPAETKPQNGAGNDKFSVTVEKEEPADAPVAAKAIAAANMPDPTYPKR